MKDGPGDIEAEKIKKINDKNVIILIPETLA